MIYSLNGELIFCDSASCIAVIECAGVGYRAAVTSDTAAKLNNVLPGAKARLFTYMQVREDAVELFGFLTTEEHDAFCMLISVSGVGPKAAMSILSILSPGGLALAIASEDTRAISKASGVGAKIAARIVLELRDKFTKRFPVGFSPDSAALSGGKENQPKSGKLSDARDALVVLGFSRSEAAAALGRVDTSGETEDIVKAALALLMK